MQTTDALPQIRYSQLNIIQKINLKGNRVAAMNKYGIETNGWMPIDIMYSNYGQHPRDYSTPFYFSRFY